jgi:sensor domain CHASE-containing protein
LNQDPSRQRTGAGVYAPVIALAAGVLAVLALVVTVMVNQFDDVALTMQVQTAERGYRNRLTSFAAMVQPRLESEDAVRHIGQVFDPHWVEQSLARYFYDRNNISRLLVMDGRDRLMFLAVNGRRVDQYPAMTAYSNAVDVLLKRCERPSARYLQKNPVILAARSSLPILSMPKISFLSLTSTLVRRKRRWVAKRAARHLSW